MEKQTFQTKKTLEENFITEKFTFLRFLMVKIQTFPMVYVAVLVHFILYNTYRATAWTKQNLSTHQWSPRRISLNESVLLLVDQRAHRVVEAIRSVPVQAHGRAGSWPARAAVPAKNAGRRKTRGRDAGGHAEGLWPPPEVVFVESGCRVVRRIVVVAVPG